MRKMLITNGTLRILADEELNLEDPGQDDEL